MKNLKDYIQESILDDKETALKNAGFKIITEADVDKL